VRTPEREESPIPIGGGPDTCRKQITFDYPDTMTGPVRTARSARRATTPNTL